MIKRMHDKRDQAQAGLSLIEVGLVLILAVGVMGIVTPFIFKGQDLTTSRLAAQEMIELINVTETYLSDQRMDNGITQQISLDRMREQGYLKRTSWQEKDENVFGQVPSIVIKTTLDNEFYYSPKAMIFFSGSGDRRLSSETIEAINSYVGDQAGRIEGDKLVGFNNSWSQLASDWYSGHLKSSENLVAFIHVNDVSSRIYVKLPAISFAPLIYKESGNEQTANVNNGGTFKWKPEFSNDDILVQWNSDVLMDEMLVTIENVGSSNKVVLSKLLYGQTNYRFGLQDGMLGSNFRVTLAPKKGNIFGDKISFQLSIVDSGSIKDNNQPFYILRDKEIIHSEVSMGDALDDEGKVEANTDGGVETDQGSVSWDDLLG